MWPAMDLYVTARKRALPIAHPGRLPCNPRRHSSIPTRASTRGGPCPCLSLLACLPFVCRAEHRNAPSPIARYQNDSVLIEQLHGSAPRRPALLHLCFCRFCSPSSAQPVAPSPVQLSQPATQLKRPPLIRLQLHPRVRN